MLVHEFQAKWRNASLKERSAAQEHFIDLCTMLGQPTPATADPIGARYTFEKGLTQAGGGQGFADVWMLNHFAWEYKGRHANLDAAYRQLLMYKDDLQNPPLLVVCDLNRFRVYTNFTGTVTQIHEFTLDQLDRPEFLRVLRNLFENPTALKPGVTVEKATTDVAERFGDLALHLSARGVDPHRAAHFLVQLLFCLFAEDIGLLPNRIFNRLMQFAARNPDQFQQQVEALFVAMRDGGVVALEEIPKFNGGLFAEVDVVRLEPQELTALAEAATLDWSSIEPSIIGTLFERSLDPSKRAQLGAHYTGRRDIERVVEPVLMAPLRRKWEAVQAQAEVLREAWQGAATPRTAQNRRNELIALLGQFQDELSSIRVLDPACGSGNFLYVALAALLDLEKEVSRYAATSGLSALFSQVHPRQVLGLEINEYAAELASVVIWIGYLQWLQQNGMLGQRSGSILENLGNIRLQDALLDRSDPDHPKEAQWPEADVIIGNPPFLGAKKLRSELGDGYVSDLFKTYGNRVPGMSDLVCYFFEKGRSQIEAGHSGRAGLLATNSIRGGASRTVLDRIKATGDIFLAWPDEPWILDGAAVRISIVGFDNGVESVRLLNGDVVSLINSSLTAGVDLALVQRLEENAGLGFVGDVKAGAFDITGDRARQWIALPLNPNGQPNSDVLLPWINGLDITRRPRDMWIIDFGVDVPEDKAALYEAPYEYVREHVKPARDKVKRARYRQYWWLHAEPVSGMRSAIGPLNRYIVTPTVAKYRLFAWVDGAVIPDHQLIVFARDDDYFFGVLHSRAHEVWSLRMGTWLGVGNDPRYTPTTCFETFPFPRPTDEQRAEIGAAAKALDDLRRAWLDPPDADEATLKKRTLTNLYNQRPTWLSNAHARLDRAVWAAYGWPEPPAETDDETILTRLLALNLERAGESDIARR